MKIHIAQKGDTLYKLAKTYNIDVEKLIASNPQLPTPDDIKPGMKIIIPSKSVKLKNNSFTNQNEIQKKTRMQMPKKLPPSADTGSQHADTSTSGKTNLPSKRKVGRSNFGVQTKTEKEKNNVAADTIMELQFQGFTPHKRMEVDMETDFEKQMTQKLRHYKTEAPILHKGRDTKGNVVKDNDVYCDQCQHPMQIKQPLYFPVPKQPSNGILHQYPHIPANLLHAKPNKYFS